jgi:hypothetical protein
MEKSKKHVLLINSADTESKNKYDGYYNMNDEFLHNTRSCQFKSITFSNTIYNINSHNQKLDYSVGGVSNSVNIPIGNYNVTTFVTAFNSAQSSIVITDNTTTKTFSFNSTPLTRIFVSSTLSRVLGITADTTNATNYIANSIYNFIYTYMVHIVSNELAENDNIITSSNRKLSIIASVPLNVGFGFIIYHNEDRDTSDYSIFTGLRNTSTVNMRLVDDDFRTINMNGSDFIAEFTLHTS